MRAVLNPKDYKNPVVFFANGVGDHLIFLPTLRALSKLFEGRITFVGLPRVLGTFLGGVSLKRIIELEPSSRALESWSFGLLKGELEQLPLNDVDIDRAEVDLFISASSWKSRQILNFIRSIAPAVTIGFFPEFDYVSSYTGHSFDEYFSFVNLFSNEDQIGAYAYPPIVASQDQTLLAKFRKVKAHGHKILVVHTDTKRRKMVQPESILGALDLFLDSRRNYLAVIVGLRHDLELRNARYSERIVDFCRLPLALTFGIISAADLFLGIDSSMLHVADLSRVPGVGIFGPTSPEIWGFKFSLHEHILFSDTQPINESEIAGALFRLEKGRE